jgi:AcrR family transcriptional regulator
MRKKPTSLISEQLSEARFAGFVAARQSRSRDTVDALMRAAGTLLNKRALDQISISEICAEAGVTTGAFYSRFEGKEAFFSALQYVVCERRAREFDEFIAKTDLNNMPLADCCRQLAEIVVNYVRSDIGLLRASLHQSRLSRDWWTPFRDLGARHKSLLTSALASHVMHLPPRQRSMRLQFAYQMMAGTVVHTVLNEPGPLKIDDRHFIDELAHMLVSYLQATEQGEARKTLSKGVRPPNKPPLQRKA